MEQKYDKIIISAVPKFVAWKDIFFLNTSLFYNPHMDELAGKQHRKLGRPSCSMISKDIAKAFDFPSDTLWLNG